MIAPRRFAAGSLIVLAGCSSPTSGDNNNQGNDPPGSQQVTIAYSGRFDMTNFLQPQSTPHSYTYTNQWSYTWNGSWDQLFGGGRVNSGAISFQIVNIAGTTAATYRNIATGPDVQCTMTIVANSATPPTFIAAYDRSQRRVQITNVDAPTFRFTTTTSPDPNCNGGPGVNILSAPSDFNPLGPGGGTVAVGGGRVDFEKRWQWVHNFAGASVRNYDATMRTTVNVVMP